MKVFVQGTYTHAYNTFELLLHARRGLWSPSSMQELSSFHLVDTNSGGVMMIIMSDMWDKKMFGIIMQWLHWYQIEILNYVFERTWICEPNDQGIWCE